MTSYLHKSTSAAPLAVFRIALGMLLFGGVIRFWAKGWIYELYVEPKHFFPFYGFEFVKPLGEYTYILFAACAISAFLVTLGLCYRLAMTGLFLSFTYIELIDKSTYLNHYYFISIICLMMIFLPAHTYFSMDAGRNSKLRSDRIPLWSLDSLKFFVCIVYLYAGLAKVNSDWLFEAQPLRIWLPAKNDVPIIGPLFNKEWVAYAFSWGGCLYDLTIPFLLMIRRTRIFAYIGVIVFHTLTAVLFPIGMFPYIMMVTALIFFPANFHQKIIARIATWLNAAKHARVPSREYRHSPFWSKGLPIAFGIFLLIQMLLPFRYVLYPGELFWTEQGYRFSWRVMLMEKAGYAEFTVRDADGKHEVVDNRQFLTALQEKMMATQPDMILQYAHIIRDHFAAEGFRHPRVYVDSYVTLNGRLGRTLIDPATDLAREEESFSHKTWILSFDHEIKGI
ncbi:MAG TPA: HTTM domain-containing protein [Chryseosolibacter sp.]|nr:HTTM domain-containing protein [Chryseosolibacter sp.]